MKIKTTREQMKSTLSKMLDVVPTKHAVPAISCVRIAPLKDGGGIEVFGTDSNIFLRVVMRCDAEGDGDAVVNFRLLYDLIKYSADGEIVMESSDGRLRIKTDTGTCSFVTIDSRFFPKWDSGNVTKECLVLPRSKVLSMFDRVRFAIAPQNSTRSALKGVFLHTVGEEMRMVACNGTVLAMDVTAGVNPDCLANGILVSPSVMKVLKSIGVDEDVHISLVDGGRALFEVTDADVMTTLIEEVYPEYSAVIPETVRFNIKVKSTDMDAALRRISLFSTTPANDTIVARFDFKKEYEVEINAESPDGTLKDSVPSQGMGPDDTVYLNPTLLSEALSSTRCDEVDIGLTSAVQPIKITTDDGYTAVLMPIRNA